MPSVCKFFMNFEHTNQVIVVFGDECMVYMRVRRLCVNVWENINKNVYNL